MKHSKKRVRRFDGEEGSYIDDTDIYKAARSRDQQRANQEAYEQKIAELSKDDEQSLSYTPTISLGSRPTYTEGVDYTVAPSPKEALRAVPKPAKKTAGAGRGSYAGYDKAQAVADAARRDFASRTANEALEEIHPELNMLPGGGIKNIAALARAAAGKQAAKVAPYLKEIPYQATKLLEGYRPNFVMMKKGGKVKSAAKRVEQSSASKRGDGIASKGKTKTKHL